jgi:hypothetical protein
VPIDDEVPRFELFAKLLDLPPGVMAEKVDPDLVPPPLALLLDKRPLPTLDRKSR